MYTNRYFLFLLFFYSNVVIASDWLGEGKMLAQEELTAAQARRDDELEKEADNQRALEDSQEAIKAQIVAASQKAYEKDGTLLVVERKSQKCFNEHASPYYENLDLATRALLSQGIYPEAGTEAQILAASEKAYEEDGTLLVVEHDSKNPNPFARTYTLALPLGTQGVDFDPCHPVVVSEKKILSSQGLSDGSKELYVANLSQEQQLELYTQDLQWVEQRFRTEGTISDELNKTYAVAKTRLDLFQCVCDENLFEENRDLAQQLLNNLKTTDLEGDTFDQNLRVAQEAVAGFMLAQNSQPTSEQLHTDSSDNYSDDDDLISVTGQSDVTTPTSEEVLAASLFNTTQDNVASAQTADLQVHPDNIRYKAEAEAKQLQAEYDKQVEYDLTQTAMEMFQLRNRIHRPVERPSSATNTSPVSNPGFVEAHSPEAADFYRAGQMFDSLPGDFFAPNIPSEKADDNSLIIQRLTAEKEEVERNLKETKAYFHNVSSQLHDKTKEVETLSKQLFDSGVSISELDQLLDQSQQSLARETDYRIQLQKTSTKLAASLGEQIDLVRKHETIAYWTKITNRSQKVQSNVLRFIQNCKIAVLRKTLEGTKKQNEVLQVSEQSLRGKIDTLESEIATAQHARMVHAEETKQEIEKLKIQECSLSGRIEIEKEKKEKLEQELQRIIRIRDALKKEFIAFGEENKVLKSEKVNQDQKLDGILVKVSDLAADNQQHLTKIEATLSTLQAVRDAKAAGFKNGERLYQV